MRPPPDTVARAAERAADLDFLRPEDFAAAPGQARGLSTAHMAGDLDGDALLAKAATARAAGDVAAAARATGAAPSLSDKAGLWADYAGLTADLPTANEEEARAQAERAQSSAINAYLRAESADLRATALVLLAEAFELTGRGRDMIAALRLAQSIRPRDDIASALDDAIGKDGFRITATQVESDSAIPRTCAVFSDDLARPGGGLASFVRLPEPGLSVDVDGRQICIGGAAHGRRYALTFRAGLPAASGERLAKHVTVTQYVRDRTPAVRFPGRAYLLPRIGQTGIPVETVNTETLDLTQLRLSDRNLIRTIQSGYFGRPLDFWSAENLKNEMTETVWTGTGDVAMEVNRDMTTLLPLAPVMSDLGPGIYALQAAVPGRDPYDEPAAAQWFAISDLGLTAMEGSDGLHVFVRALSDASAAEGATVTLLSRANAVIATAGIDAGGYARFTAGLMAGTGGAAPALVTVERGEDFAFLSLSEPEFDLSDRGVVGRDAAGPIDIFLTTDRGAYRAGETVNATILARDGQMEALAGLPMTAPLTRPDGAEFSRTLLEDAGAGGSVATIPLADTALRRTWRIETFVEEGRPLAAQGFLVEGFLPERLDFDLSLPDAPQRLSDRPLLSVNVRHLFGAPGAGLDVEGDLTPSALTALDAFPGYLF